jgi:serine protease
MKSLPVATVLTSLAVFAAGMGGVSAAGAENTRLRPTTVPASAEARLIVTYKEGRGPTLAQTLSAGSSARDAHSAATRRLVPLAAHAGVALEAGGLISPLAHVVRAQGISAQALAERLRSHADVASVSVDERRRALAVPNDPLFSAGPLATGPAVGQWYLKATTGASVSAVNAVAAWDRVLGRDSVVVAVLDTGVWASHLDLAGAVLPGYDMINDLPTANDGDGRDADANDPGDWVTAAENSARGGPFFDCGVEDSSWHGTQVASILAARGNDGQGMAGTAYGVKILPVRVLGKCGGYDSDIQAGMRWAAGLSVPGVPTNPNPARILNLSLGGTGTCTTAYTSLFNELTAAGVAVVVAAGNSAGHSVGTPANCPGAIAVAGLRHAGSKVGFSDLGPEIFIAAPAGNCVNIGPGEPCLYPIITAINASTRSPNAGGSQWTDSFNPGYGTSFATPIVAGALGLMLSAQPALTLAEMKLALQQSARPFPQTGAGSDENGNPIQACRAPTGADQLQCYCTTALCGAGMLDALGAVERALGLHARFTVSNSSPVAGQALVFDAGGSLLGTGRQVTSYQWVVTEGLGVSGAFTGATNAATASLTPTAGGSFTVQVTVRDDLGATSAAQLTLNVAAAPVQPPVVPPPSSGSGGGGGAGLGWPWLVLLALASWALLHRRRG